MQDLLQPFLSYFVVKTCTPNWRLANPFIPFHSLTFVLEGEANFLVHEEEIRVQAGDILYIPAGSDRWATTSGMRCAAMNFDLADGQRLPLPARILGREMEEFETLCREINYEWLQRRSGYQLKCQALFALLLHKLIYEEEANRPGNLHVERMKRHIAEHYEGVITVRVLAELVGLHPVYCGALFKQTEGCTIAEYIHRVRLNKAAALLVSGEYTVGEAAERAGFSDPYYFSTRFKRHMGVTPSEYRNRRGVDAL
ncbi:helix-turn-helix transcriptional regulator [Paenibacillus daejeonensis]|uniref:helix-turn-helix transcriptional regulator n=1 Tax=Paenibacillus daejeonensis TaxID=135193 RepID=UPI0003677BCF|nr:AraC family transcriptional regulator [Paenibacillus daejeonensis]